MKRMIFADIIVHVFHILILTHIVHAYTLTYSTYLCYTFLLV